jgi:parvulin-like peptidyl-prolyl isomerase
MQCLTKFSNESLKILIKHNLLKSLIKSEIIEKLLSSVQIEQSILDESINNILKNKGVTNDEQLQLFLKTNKINKKHLFLEISQSIKRAKYCKENFNHKVDSHFLKRKQNLDQVAYSLIRVKEPFIAREIFLQLNEENANFGDIATKYSEGLEKNSRGLIGPTSLDQAHPLVIEELLKNNCGQITNPFIVDGWNIILRKESYTPAKLDEQMRMKMAYELFENWVDKETSMEYDKLNKKLSSSLSQAD